MKIIAYDNFKPGATLDDLKPCPLYPSNCLLSRAH